MTGQLWFHFCQACSVLFPLFIDEKRHLRSKVDIRSHDHRAVTTDPTNVAINGG